MNEGDDAMIIGLSGLKGSGKSTAADFLVCRWVYKDVFC